MFSSIEEQDRSLIGPMLQTLGRLEASVKEINDHVQDSHRALRGYDTEPGLVAQVRDLKQQVGEIGCDVKDDQATLGDLSGRVEKLEAYFKEYPSLTWLMHHKTKTVLAWSAAGLGILVLILSPMMSPKVATSLLKFLRIPDPLIDFYFGRP